MPDTVDRQSEACGFPIVAIGASAGGLEACSKFFGALSADTGMAFVLVQHLDPSHKSMLNELLSRITSLTTHEVEDGMLIEPDHIYVIPPNTELGILHQVLHLFPRSGQPRPHLPIDTFMRSLAEDQGSMAIGVILSGGASDGTIGLRQIKAAGGITFAQDEVSARFSSMPHSAIAAGCVDFVMLPEEIAKQLMRLAQQPRALRSVSAASEMDELFDEDSNDLNKIFMLLRNRTGNDFTHYKHTTIHRRIRRRMVLHRLPRLKDYLRYLLDNPPELDELFQDMLINVTGFFRDPEVFEALKGRIFPALFEERRDETIRIWVAGCSTGEEAYSIAIVLLESLGDRAPGTAIQIFASDIDGKAIDKARTGIYPEGIKNDVSPARLQRFFTKVAAGYQISKSIRDLCLFAVQN
ncbi:MAG: chemotaxis protein CheB, partial [Pseudomonadota bacterium]|nr:chemotaxis protein CheB [Pseudomonadota bacterium]